VVIAMACRFLSQVVGSEFYPADVWEHVRISFGFDGVPQALNACVRLEKAVAERGHVGSQRYCFAHSVIRCLDPAQAFVRVKARVSVLEPDLDCYLVRKLENAVFELFGLARIGRLGLRDTELGESA
jgi:hypothetical protein